MGKYNGKYKGQNKLHGFGLSAECVKTFSLYSSFKFQFQFKSFIFTNLHHFLQFDLLQKTNKVNIQVFFLI